MPSIRSEFLPVVRSAPLNERRVRGQPLSYLSGSHNSLCTAQKPWRPKPLCVLEGSLQFRPAQQRPRIRLTTHRVSGDRIELCGDRPLVSRTSILRLLGSDEGRKPRPQRQGHCTALATDRMRLHERSTHSGLWEMGWHEIQGLRQPSPSPQSTESRAENRNTPLRKTATPALRKTATPSGTSVAENRNISSLPLPSAEQDPWQDLDIPAALRRAR